MFQYFEGLSPWPTLDVAAGSGPVWPPRQSISLAMTSNFATGHTRSPCTVKFENEERRRVEITIEIYTK